MNNVRKIALAIAILGSVVMVTKPATQDQVAACQKLVNDFKWWQDQLMSQLAYIKASWKAQTGWDLPNIPSAPEISGSDAPLLQYYFNAVNQFRDWYGQQYMPARYAYLENLKQLTDAGVVVNGGQCSAAGGTPESVAVQKAAATKKSGRRYNRGGQRKLQRRKTQRGIRKVPTITGQ